MPLIWCWIPELPKRALYVFVPHFRFHNSCLGSMIWNLNIYILPFSSNVFYTKVKHEYSPHQRFRTQHSVSFRSEYRYSELLSLLGTSCCVDGYQDILDGYNNMQPWKCLLHCYMVNLETPPPPPLVPVRSHKPLVWTASGSPIKYRKGSHMMFSKILYWFLQGTIHLFSVTLLRNNFSQTALAAVNPL